MRKNYSYRFLIQGFAVGNALTGAANSDPNAGTNFYSGFNSERFSQTEEGCRGYAQAAVRSWYSQAKDYPGPNAGGFTQ